MKNKLIYMLTFISGMTIMAIEMSASRLLAPFFGSSMFVWASLIGSVMLFLSLGYYYGGKLADKYPFEWLLYSITLCAGIISGLIPFIAKPILNFSLNTFESNSYLTLISTLISSLILVSIPITLLAMVSPFVIRIVLKTTDKVGNISGNIFTISTIGSLLGTFLPVLVLIPNIGTQKTFLSFSFVLTTISAIGLFLDKKNILSLFSIIFIFSLFFIPNNRIKKLNSIIFEDESIYNFIHVVERENGIKELRLEEGFGTHSRYSPTKILFNDVWSYYLFAPNFIIPQDKIKNALIIGLGAGTISKIFNKYYPDLIIDGIEIDSHVVDAGKKYFEMRENKNLNIFIDDGRFFLRKNNLNYSIIMLDAYRLPYIPFHLATKEFFQETYNKLKQNGVFVVNIGRTIDDYRLVDAICSTMKTVYLQVFIFDIPGYSMNTLAFATKKKTNIEELKKSISDILIDSNEFSYISQNFLKGVKEYDQKNSAPIITDDCAPIEKIIDSIVISYVLK